MDKNIPDYNEDSRPIRVFSFGGGVQSHAVLVLQAQGKLPEPYDLFVFSNVGHDSENPETLDYLRDYTLPFCKAHGIPFLELRRSIKNRGEVTIMEEIYYQPNSIIIPAYFGQGGFGRRNCTTDFKVRVIDRYIREADYTHAVIGLGISTDEFRRARSTEWHHYEGQDYIPDEDLPQQLSLMDMETSPLKPKAKRNIGFWKQRDYPLIALRISRDACKMLIEDAGLPVPPKSSCFFCPFKRPKEWTELKENQPDLFEKAVQMEDFINAKRLHNAKDGMFLHTSKRPLREAVFDSDPDMFDGDDCDSGHCFT